MRLSIIVAVSDNGVIGREGGLPWRLSADLRRFKQLTMGHTIVMGRRTWESLGRPLPGRRTIVVSRQAGYRPTVDVNVASSLDEAMEIAVARDDDEAFVVGGAELYREALPCANRLYVTRVSVDVEGDTFFPDVDWSKWRLLESTPVAADDRNEYATLFQVYERSEATCQS